MQIYNHWLSDNDANLMLTPSFTDRVIEPKFIAMHYTASTTASSAIDTLMNPARKVSAHTVVDTNGDITQLVPFNKRAWHAGPSKSHGYKGLNNHSIGIEFVNLGYLRKTTDGFIGPYGQTRDYNVEDDCVPSKNSRIGSGTYYWPEYPEPQIVAGLKLVVALLEKYPSIEYIVTHEEIDTRGWKTDPGVAFPLNRFRKLIDGNDLDEPKVTNAYIDTASLNVRGGPGTDNEVIDMLTLDTHVHILDSVGKWYYIQYQNGDKNGWIHSNYIRR